MTGFNSKREMAAEKLWDRPSVAFDEWWNSDHYESTNPFRPDSGAYWAWAGWKAALAQPAQEPVALVIDGVLVKSELPGKYTGHLYTAPPQRTRVGLNGQDFSAINQSCLTKLQAAASAESILEEKNNG